MDAQIVVNGAKGVEIQRSQTKEISKIMKNETAESEEIPLTIKQNKNIEMEKLKCNKSIQIKETPETLKSVENSEIPSSSRIMETSESVDKKLLVDETHQGKEIVEEQRSDDVSASTSQRTEISPNMDIERGVGQYEGIGIRESGHGTLYHLKLCMLSLLRALELSNRGYSFGMAAEHKKLNPFDDIVFLLNADGKKLYYLIQVKHGQTQKQKEIIANDFLKEKSNNWGSQFTLHKYFKGYCQLRKLPEFETSKINFIVCTNINLDLDDFKKHCISIKACENHLFMEIIRESKNKCYKLTSKGKCVVYKALKGKDASDDEISNFLNEFSLVVDLPNEEALGQIIKKEIGTMFNCLNTDLMSSEFQNRLLEWLKPRMGSWITKDESEQFTNEIVNLINSLGAKGLEISHKLRDYGVHILNEHLVIIANQIENFLESEDHFLQIINKNNSSFLTLLKIHQALEQYKLLNDSDGIYETDVLYTRFKSFSEKESREYVQSALASPNSHKLLIVSCLEKDKVSRYIYKYLGKITKICIKKNKKIILITEKKTDLSDLDEEIDDLKTVEANDEGFTFLQLTDETKENLLALNVVLFQGNEQKTCLASLFKSEKRLEAKTEIAKIVDSDILVKLIKNEDIRIGDVMKGNPVLNDIYIERKLQKKDTSVIMNEDDLMTGDSSVFIITGKAGSGKSTLLNSLLRKLSADYSTYHWLCRINLNYFTKIFSEELELRRNGKSMFDIIDTKKTMDFLVDHLLESHSDTKLETAFEKNMFKLGLEGYLNVILVFDAFDEICPNYMEIVKDLLDSLIDMKFQKLFLTTRDISNDDAYTESRDERESKAVELARGTYLSVVPLSEDEQKSFAVEYWISASDVNDKQEIWKLEAIFSEVVKSWVDVSLLGNPLTLFLTTDYWTIPVLEIFNAPYEPETGYINSHISSVSGKHGLHEIELCKYFIEKKLEIYQLDKSRDSSGNISSNNKNRFFIIAVQNVHTYLALSHFFGQDRASELKGDKPQLDEYIQVELPKIGFVQHIENEYLFLHKRFTEHFVTEFIHNEPNKVKDLFDLMTWEIFADNTDSSRLHFTFKYIVEGWLDIYVKTRNKVDTVRLNYIFTYLALVRAYGQRKTKWMLKDKGLEIDEDLQTELLSTGLLKEGLEFVYWRFADYFVHVYLKNNTHNVNGSL